MRACHAAAAVDVAFDDPNLIADAGLVPVMAATSSAKSHGEHSANCKQPVPCADADGAQRTGAFGPTRPAHSYSSSSTAAHPNSLKKCHETETDLE
jgi:hypothetical protein